MIAKVPASDWKEYKKFVDAIGVEPWIQLTSKDRNAGEKGSPLAGENNPVAAELVRKALAAVTEKKDNDLAREELNQAAAINDKQRALWSQEGYLATLDNQFDVAVVDYQRELKQYPDESFVYPYLIYAQGRLGKKADQREFAACLCQGRAHEGHGCSLCRQHAARQQ